MTRLHHLTLNTGHVAATSRSDVADGVIDRLLPVLDAQGGPVPVLPGWHLDLFFPVQPDGGVRPGSAFYQVADEPGSSTRPVAVADGPAVAPPSIRAAAAALAGGLADAMDRPGRAAGRGDARRP